MSVGLKSRQSALSVTATDLAVMGATLADGGVNPVTREQVASSEVCRDTLAVLASCGLYERSGEWLFEIGLPAKSGVAGGIVAISPGKGALGTFSPRLDAAGNSIRGQRACAYLSRDEEQRLRTLKPGFLILAGISAVAALPASRLPKYRPGEIPETR